MSNCNVNVNFINENEKIGDSLTKINNNFSALQQLACEVESLLDITQVRTFFYYGPNAPGGDSTTYPANTTIQTFVNGTNSLNLPSISETGDIAYVIYQKTGFWNPPPVLASATGSGTVPFSRDYQVEIPITRIIDISRRQPVVVGYYTETRTQVEYIGYTWTEVVEDRNNSYAPIFVIYRLTFNGTTYTVNTGYPKFNYGLTASTSNWNNPTTWSTY